MSRSRESSDGNSLMEGKARRMKKVVLLICIMA